MILGGLPPVSRTCDNKCDSKALLTGSSGRRDINIEGRYIDYCMNSGKDCGQPVADAVCQYLGFDGAVADQLASATADAPARSLTGAALTYACGLERFRAHGLFGRGAPVLRLLVGNDLLTSAECFCHRMA